MKRAFNRLATFSVSAMNRLSPLIGRPRVPAVTTPQVCELLESSEKSVVLVDVRSSREQDVSRLPGAVTLDEFRADAESHRDQIVIPYCTVGGRSLLVTQSLVKQGFDARNYHGSILDWCEYGLPLATPEAEETNRVHTHSRLYHIPSQYSRANDG